MPSTSDEIEESIQDLLVQCQSEKMKGRFGSFMKSLRSSKRVIMLITVTAVVTLIVGSLISIWFGEVANLSVPSLGTIKTLGVEAYSDEDLENTVETVGWGVIRPGASSNVTLYLRSISNVDITLSLTTTDWNPANISDYMNLTWNYNQTTIHSGEIVEVILTLSSSSSYSFYLYIIANAVKEFSFDVHIRASECENVARTFPSH